MQAPLGTQSSECVNTLIMETLPISSHYETELIGSLFAKNDQSLL